MRAISLIAVLSLVAGCTSTYTQEVTSANYQPVYPTEPMFAVERQPTGGIYSANAQGLFVQDRRAADVGDVLTVELSERFSASKSQSSSNGRSSSYSADLPGFLGALDDSALTTSSSQSFAGSGAAAQSNSLRGRMTVQVVRVLPGGLLEIMGEKRLTLNTGNEYIRVTGIIRQEDITAENTVDSDRIANADIQYVGAGQTADTARPGWLGRAINVAAPL